jgi:hypothetical protein
MAPIAKLFLRKVICFFVIAMIIVPYLDNFVRIIATNVLSIKLTYFYTITDTKKVICM